MKDLCALIEAYAEACVEHKEQQTQASLERFLDAKNELWSYISDHTQKTRWMAAYNDGGEFMMESSSLESDLVEYGNPGEWIYQDYVMTISERRLIGQWNGEEIIHVDRETRKKQGL